MSERKKSKVIAPDRSIVSIETARRAANDGMLSDLNAPVTRIEMINGCANAAMAVGQKMYDQFSEETQAFLQQMELDIIARSDARMNAKLAEITAAFEARLVGYAAPIEPTA